MTSKACQRCGCLVSGPGPCSCKCHRPPVRWWEVVLVGVPLVGLMGALAYCCYIAAFNGVP